MNRIVKARLRISGATSAIEHIVGDGTAFFNAMDDWLCAPEWYSLQLDRYLDKAMDSLYVNQWPEIVVSGEWGRRFAAWYALRWATPEVLVLPGGLRHNELPPLEVNLSLRSFIFLDNSCYKGRTRDKIRAGIEKVGGRMVDTLVLYDGSREPIDGITGVFRYHSV